MSLSEFIKYSAEVNVVTFHHLVHVFYRQLLHLSLFKKDCGLMVSARAKRKWVK